MGGCCSKKATQVLSSSHLYPSIAPKKMPSYFFYLWLVWVRFFFYSCIATPDFCRNFVLFFFNGSLTFYPFRIVFSNLTIMFVLSFFLVLSLNHRSRAFFSIFKRLNHPVAPRAFLFFFFCCCCDFFSCFVFCFQRNLMYVTILWRRSQNLK